MENYSIQIVEWQKQTNEKFQKLQFIEGIKCYDQALKIDSKYTVAINSYSLHCLNKYEEAIKFYKQTILKDPDYAAAYNSKGHTLISFFKGTALQRGLFSCIFTKNRTKYEAQLCFNEANEIMNKQYLHKY